MPVVRRTRPKDATAETASYEIQSSIETHESVYIFFEEDVKKLTITEGKIRIELHV